MRGSEPPTTTVSVDDGSLFGRVLLSFLSHLEIIVY